MNCSHTISDDELDEHIYTYMDKLGFTPEEYKRHRESLKDPKKRLVTRSKWTYDLNTGEIMKYDVQMLINEDNQDILLMDLDTNKEFVEKTRNPSVMIYDSYADANNAAKQARRKDVQERYYGTIDLP